MGREIYDIINDMAEVLNVSQMQKLQEVLIKRLSENTVFDYLQTTNVEFLDMFLTAKHLEGCSDKTIRYYRCNIEKMLETINISVIKITTEMLRKYLVEYQLKNNCGEVTIDNIRRSLSTFFSWLEEEHYMEDIYNYIALELLSPENAMGQYNRIADEILTLDTFPQRYRIMDSELEKQMELRRMLVDNYPVFYTIRGDKVIVTDVLYTASDIERWHLEIMFLLLLTVKFE